MQNDPGISHDHSKLDGHRSVSVNKRGWLRRLFAFVGPAYLVSVGYMDPGNWATDIAGGSRFGYSLIWVLLMSNLMAVLLQTLSARLGIVTGFDLAQGNRREYPRAVNFSLWILAEIAIAACDLAEVLGTIIGLNLLFGLPLLWGCAVTALDTFLLLAIQRLGVRKMEAFIVSLVFTIGCCFLIEVLLAKPDWGGIVNGFVPSFPLTDDMLYVAIGIIGATVMPHNLYLHSALVQSRAIGNSDQERAEACKYNLIDSAIALNGAFFVNAAILVMAAANFFSRNMEVTEIQQAHSLLAPIVGASVAPILFAVALLAAGQSSTLTGTLAGQIIMEGYLNIRLKPWLRRLLTRGLALIPAVLTIVLAGSEGITRLLVLSQVILSLQLPFAVIPLIHFTSDRTKMGRFANKPWVVVLAIISATIIVGLNVKLVFDTVSTWLETGPEWLYVVVLPLCLGVGALLVYITFRPMLVRSSQWTVADIPLNEQLGRTVPERITPMHIRNVCAAIEHTDADVETISAALSMALERGANLTLLHVTETPGTMVYGNTSASLHSEEDRKYLEAIASRISAPNITVKTMLRYGSVVDEIVAAVEDYHFDMLVMGSHGHRGLADVVYGQTVTSVRHRVMIPVLVVRSSFTGGEKAQR